VADDSYALSDAQRKAIYDGAIRPRYLEIGARDLTQPVAIITGGQPGSGKSGLRRDAEVFLSQQGGAAISDPDELRRFHPRYAEFNAQDDKTAAGKTQPDASAWAKQLLVDAVAERRNIILDRTLGSPGQLAQMSQLLKEAGYRIHVEAMAVRPEVSAVRIHLRYEGQKAEYGHGRFTPREFHDAAFAGLAKTLDRAQRDNLVSSIRLYDAAANRIYSSQLGDQGWSNKNQAGQVLTYERSRPYAYAEWLALRQQTQQVVDLRTRPERDATAAELKELKALKAVVTQIGAAQGFKLGQEPKPTPYAVGRATQITPQVTIQQMAQKGKVPPTQSAQPVKSR